MMIEGIILVAFVSLQAGFHMAPKLFDKIAHLAIVQRISKHGYIVWLLHPSIIHGLHDYIVHFVVYSGKVIAAH